MYSAAYHTDKQAHMLRKASFKSNDHFTRKHTEKHKLAYNLQINLKYTTQHVLILSLTRDHHPNTFCPGVYLRHCPSCSPHWICSQHCRSHLLGKYCLLMNNEIIKDLPPKPPPLFPPNPLFPPPKEPP